MHKIYCLVLQAIGMLIQSLSGSFWTAFFTIEGSQEAKWKRAAEDDLAKKAGKQSKTLRTPETWFPLQFLLKNTVQSSCSGPSQIRYQPIAGKSTRINSGKELLFKFPAGQRSGQNRKDARKASERIKASQTMNSGRLKMQLLFPAAKESRDVRKSRFTAFIHRGIEADFMNCKIHKENAPISLSLIIERCKWRQKSTKYKRRIQAAMDSWWKQSIRQPEWNDSGTMKKKTVIHRFLFALFILPTIDQPQKAKRETRFKNHWGAIPNARCEYVQPGWIRFGFILELRWKALPAFRIDMASTASKPEPRLTMNLKTAPARHL